MHNFHAHTLIIESEWGESKFFFRKSMCLHDISATLKALNFRPEILTESGGIARTYHPGLFSDIVELEERLIPLNVVDHYKSNVIDTPNDVCPILVDFASLCNEVHDDTKTSGMGGAVSKGTEEKANQSD